MTMTKDRPRISFKASDVTGQRTYRVPDVPADAKVGEIREGLVTSLGLPRNSAEGAAISYQLRLEREGRHLEPAEEIGLALQEDDHVVLLPNIDAGGRVGA